MNRRDLLKSAGAALGLAALPWHRAVAGEPAVKKSRVLFFTRSVRYEHTVVHRKGDRLSLAEQTLVELGKQAGFDVDCTKDGRVFDRDLDQYDVLAFFTNRDQTLPNKRKDPPVSFEGKERFLKAIADGKGFVGIHGCCGPWRLTPSEEKEKPGQRDPYITMLGGNIITHGPRQKATVTVVSPDFPGASGLGESFRLHDEWYALENFADDMHVILVQQTEGMQGRCYRRPPYPNTWARRQGKGRVFYTGMGHHEKAWASDHFRKILLGGIAWAMGNVDADVQPNIDRVAPKARQVATASVEHAVRDGKETHA